MGADVDGLTARRRARLAHEVRVSRLRLRRTFASNSNSLSTSSPSSRRHTSLANGFLMKANLTSAFLVVCPVQQPHISYQSCPADFSPFTMPFRPIPLSSQIFNPTLYKSVRAFWFSGLPEDSVGAPDSLLGRWFGLGSPEEKASFDQQCHSNFCAALDSIGPNIYPLPPAQSYHEEKETDLEIAKPFLEHIERAQNPETSASTALSLFILLDQIPRNIFRQDQKLIYTHYDRMSRALARTMLSMSESKRWDLSPQYRSGFVFREWMYMPLEHSEYIKDHEDMVRCLSSAAYDVPKDSPQSVKDYIEKTLGFEDRHIAIIKRFGRYPHRNKPLKRETTKEEKDWLEGGGDTFGSG